MNTPCNLNTALCDRGECNKSICTLINNTECSLTIADVIEPLQQRGINREYLCHIGCWDCKSDTDLSKREIGRIYLSVRTNSCVDTHDLLMPNNLSTTGFGYKYRPGRWMDFILLVDVKVFSIGHACAGSAGYCDVFGKCRAVDAEGPLLRLKNMFLNEQNILTLTDIVRVCDDSTFSMENADDFFSFQYHWWALILGLFGLIGFMSIFVKICSVHTPSSNPRLKPARSFSFKRQVNSLSNRTNHFYVVGDFLAASISSFSSFSTDWYRTHWMRSKSVWKSFIWWSINWYQLSSNSSKTAAILMKKTIEVIIHSLVDYLCIDTNVSLGVFFIRYTYQYYLEFVHLIQTELVRSFFFFIS